MAANRGLAAMLAKAISPIRARKRGTKIFRSNLR